jgi:two-component system sensor histidine kinase UhpB
MKRFFSSVAFIFMAMVCYSQTAVIDSLLLQAAKHTGDTNEIRVLDRLAGEFMRRDIVRAKTYVWQEIALAKKLHTDFGLAPAYSGLVSIHQNDGRIDSAQYYIDQLAALAKKNPHDKKASLSYYSATGLFYKNQSKYKEALPYLKEALRFADREKDKPNYAGQLLNIGNTYFGMGDFRNAADYHLRSLSLFEEAKHSRGQSFALQSLGNDFFELKQYSTAEKYLLRSEKMKSDMGDKRGVMTSWMTLGSVYQQTGKYERSMQYFNDALARSRELKLPLEELRALFNLGSLFKSMKRFDESRTYFNESLRLAAQAEDSVTVARIRTYLVSLSEDAKKVRNEEQSLLHNISISKEKGALTHTAEGHLQLAEWYASQKQYENAFRNFKKGQLLKDSLTGDAVVMQLRTLEEEYKNEKREKEISLLKKDQELQALALSRQRVVIFSIALALVSVVAIGLLLVNRYRAMNNAKRLIEIERVRNSIARDLHDDIGSTLSSINIMSQVALVEKGNPATYLQRIGNQSARIMDDLGDMVWSINPRNDSIQHVINRMREFAAEIFEFKGIDYEFKVDIKESLVLTPEQRKNLFLIFKESVNNAAKYSQATFVGISLEQHRNMLGMRVKDNGLGFDEQLVQEGNGFRNLRERTKELQGSLQLKSSLSEGTMVEVQLPIA